MYSGIYYSGFSDFVISENFTFIGSGFFELVLAIICILNENFYTSPTTVNVRRTFIYPDQSYV